MADPLFIAIVSTMPPTLVAGVGVWITQRGNRQVGRKNGKGTLIQMVSELHEWKGEHTLEHELIAEEEADFRDSLEV